MYTGLLDVFDRSVDLKGLGDRLTEAQPVLHEAAKVKCLSKGIRTLYLWPQDFNLCEEHPGVQ